MKNIILTGSSSGFGFLTAQTLAAQGHRVFATMRNTGTSNKEAAHQITDWAKNNKAQITVIELDVTNDTSVEKAVKEIAAMANGRIDVLINNAGACYIGLNETLSAAQTDQLFQINVIGVDRMIKAVLPFMHNQHEGHIVTLSSVASRQPVAIMGAYGATKAAVDALCVSYYYELRSSNIDISLIQPGAYPNTDIVTKQVKPANPMAFLHYGEDMIKLQERIIGTFTPTPESPDSQEVADAIVKVIQTPKTDRELWTLVGAGPFEPIFNNINMETKKIIDTIFQVSGITPVEAQ